jgi:hypothetical protein
VDVGERWRPHENASNMAVGITAFKQVAQEAIARRVSSNARKRASTRGYGGQNQMNVIGQTAAQLFTRQRTWTLRVI